MEAGKVKWFVIVNPVAGGGRGLDHFPQISRYLRDAQILCEPVFTEHKFHATELTVTAVNEGYRHIIVVGGDGTLHEVVNGLFIQQKVCPDEVLLAVVAVGTGNDWVRTFGISNRYQDAVKAISEGYSFLQDVGVVSYEESHYRQSRYMANVAGAGFDAHVVRKFSHLKKKGRKNRWIYTWCLVRQFFRYKSTGMKVWVDDRLVYNNLLLSIAIGICKYNGGGMQQLPEAVADDGMLDVSLIRPVHFCCSGSTTCSTAASTVSGISSRSAAAVSASSRRPKYRSRWTGSCWAKRRSNSQSSTRQSGSWSPRSFTTGVPRRRVRARCRRCSGVLRGRSGGIKITGRDFLKKSRPAAFGRAMRQLTLSITSTSVITHSKRSLAHCPCNWRSCDMSVVSARMALKNCDIVS